VVLVFVLVFHIWAAFSKNVMSKRIWKKYGPFFLRFIKAKKYLHRCATTLRKIGMEMTALELRMEQADQKNQEIRRITQLFKLKVDAQMQLAFIMKGQKPEERLTTSLAFEEIGAEYDKLKKEYEKLVGEFDKELAELRRSLNHLTKRERLINKRSNSILALYVRARPA
ncbi:hypothetical protein KKE60_00850, partial [Patescibacteria group bacterium]|nr:hypothetical protein [Patescibacteria group bacterium]